MAHDCSPRLSSVKQVRAGGRFAGAGWMPAAPEEHAPPREVLLDLEIVRQPQGDFVLDWRSRSGGIFGVTWHDSLEQALALAEATFGIAPDEWRAAAGGPPDR